MIEVNRPFLPPKTEYDTLTEGIWERSWLTNNGILVQQLEESLKERLNIPSMYFVGNGTLALQIAIKALDLRGEIITTPFSYIATTTSIIWEKCVPVYVDIKPDTLCIDPKKIEASITERTTAILATHVYGIPCDVEKIEKIAHKYKLKVIYDAAHAFGVEYKNNSLLSYGDISTLSFHATKLYHTVEGGGIVNNAGPEVENNIKLLRSFGLNGLDSIAAGINAKNSEFHAAMGLCNLKYIDENHRRRVEIANMYEVALAPFVKRPYIAEDVRYNYSYYPIIFETQQKLIHVFERLKQNDIFARRQFYPSLNKLSYTNQNVCEISEDIASRILCLPFYYDLKNEEVEQIIHVITQCFEELI